jgi:ParB/RepB/Spo0J family partition protein
MTKNPPAAVAAAATAAIAAIAGTCEVAMLHPSRIARSPTNPRKTFNESSLIELGASMKTDGQVQAIVVRPITADAAMLFNKEHPGFEGPHPDFELVSGERRWRAATMGDFDLRAEIRPLSDLAVVRIQIIENLHREEVHPIEEAAGYEYLLRHSGEGITVDQIADEVGKSRAYVYQRMKLTSLCEEARKKFYAGDFDASTALLIARIPTPALQLQAIQEIDDIYVDDGDKPSYRDIRNMLHHRFHLQLANAPFDVTLEDLVPGCGSCTACPKRTGNEPMLFQDLADKDTCTDPDCFAAKKTAGRGRMISDARQQGLQVIEGEQAQALQPRSWQRPEGHVRLDDTAYLGDDNKPVTYADAIEQAGKKAPKPVLFVNPHRDDAMPEQLLSNEDATKLLKKIGRSPKAAIDPKPSAADIAQRQAWQQELRARTIDNSYKHMLKAALGAKADKPRTAADLVLVIFAVANGDMTDDMLTAAGVTLPPEDEERDFDWEGAFLDGLRAADPSTLGAIALRLTLGLLGDSHIDLPVAALEDAARAHKINIDGMRQKAEQQAYQDETEDEDAEAEA